VNELEVIARLLPHMARRGGDLLIGAGEDDAAAWREEDGTFTVATCDTAVETIHFDLSRQGSLADLRPDRDLDPRPLGRDGAGADLRWPR
jgi:thiamine monophosphate kinase